MKFKERYTKVLTGLLALLGFSGCVFFPQPVAYGTPYAHYIVKGTVVDEKTGKPIEGIQVIIPRVDHHQRPTSTFTPGQRIISVEVRDTAYTEKNGIFEFKYTGMQSNDSTNIIMKFKDVAENPRFKTDSTKITFFASDLKGGKGWYQGSASRNVNIELSDQECE